MYKNEVFASVDHVLNAGVRGCAGAAPERQAGPAP